MIAADPSTTKNESIFLGSWDSKNQNHDAKE